MGDEAFESIGPLASEPIESTLTGADDAAVVGSGTSNVIWLEDGFEAVREIAPTEVSSGTITNGTGFDSASEGEGF